MSKSSWMSKVVRFGAMAAGSAAFVAALAVSGGHVPVAAAKPAANPVGPLSATCASLDGRACPREGIIIHCSDPFGGRGHCDCFEHEWSCFPG
jgi:hypothetical protein